LTLPSSRGADRLKSVTTELLIDAIVRQTTVFIAQLATAGGARTPIADVAEQVFLELVRELERQGVSRKVTADMFGMALRTFRRRIQRLSESHTVSNRSLWEAIHAFITEREVVTQSEVLRHFHRDDEELARGPRTERGSERLPGFPRTSSTGVSLDSPSRVGCW
jgi:hypothetical protein